MVVKVSQQKQTRYERPFILWSLVSSHDAIIHLLWQLANAGKTLLIYRYQAGSCFEVVSSLLPCCCWVRVIVRAGSNPSRVSTAATFPSLACKPANEAVPSPMLMWFPPSLCCATCAWIQVNLEAPEVFAICNMCNLHAQNATFIPLFQRTEHIERTWWRDSFLSSWTHPGSPHQVFCYPNSGIRRRKKQGWDRGTYNMLALHKMREWAVIPQFKSLISILSCLIRLSCFWTNIDIIKMQMQFGGWEDRQISEQIRTHDEHQEKHARAHTHARSEQYFKDTSRIIGIIIKVRQRGEKKPPSWSRGPFEWVLYWRV